VPIEGLQVCPGYPVEDCPDNRGVKHGVMHGAPISWRLHELVIGIAYHKSP
jgi:hypothetical protein